MGDDQNVNLNLDDVARSFHQHLTPRLVDLLELAAYVYSADSSTQRGSGWTTDAAQEKYDREFHLVMPVRDLEFWRSPSISKKLTSALSFLTDDDWKLDFVRCEGRNSIDGYLSFGADKWPFQSIDRVLMFSGGLDSLAGALETGAAGGRLLLVSHRSKASINKRQQALVGNLAKMFPGRVAHVPVWVNKDKDLGREHTQRSRSFLFAALGAVVAESVRAAGVRFFENGVVSVNLPVAEEVKRSRASRTTHPLGLQMFAEIFGMILGRPLVVDNPFLARTKTEVVELIARHGGRDMISETCSCAHTGHFQARAQQHCGTCSQCIDRRMAVLAAGLEKCDPETDYVSDVFTGVRKGGYEQNMAVDWVHHGLALHNMSDDRIAQVFNLELTRAARPFNNRSATVKMLIDVHRRHATAVHSVLVKQMAQASEAQISGELDRTCLLAKVASGAHLQAPWLRYAHRIADILSAALPVACEKQRPKNEPELQQICDGLLVAAGEKLIREFPFLRWSSVKTKPGWSDEEAMLWVELKYVRTKADLGPISEAVAADITKYGDNRRRTLFVVYDPNHLILNEEDFAAPIVGRPGCALRIVR